MYMYIYIHSALVIFDSVRIRLILFGCMCFHHPKCISFHIHRCLEWLPSRKTTNSGVVDSPGEAFVSCVANDKKFIKVKQIYNTVGRATFCKSDKMFRPFPVFEVSSFPYNTDRCSLHALKIAYGLNLAL